MRRVAALAVVTVMVCVCGAYTWYYSRLFSSIDRQAAAVSGLQGSAMPEFDVIDPGGRVRPISVVLAKTTGRLRAVALVRPGCPRCEALTARLQAVQREFPERFGVLMVDVSERPAAGTALRPASGGFRDAEHAFERVFSGVITPVLLLVGTDGRVVHTWSGLPAPQSLEAACARLLSQGMP